MGSTRKLNKVKTQEKAFEKAKCENKHVFVQSKKE